MGQQGIITGGTLAALHFSAAPQPAPPSYSFQARPATVVSHEVPKEPEVPGVDVLVALAIVVQNAAAAREGAAATIKDLEVERDALVASRDRADREAAQLREQLHELLDGAGGGREATASQTNRTAGGLALRATGAAPPVGNQTTLGSADNGGVSSAAGTESALIAEKLEIGGELLVKCEKTIIHLLNFDKNGFGIDRQQRGPKGTWRSPVSIICEDLGMTSRDWEQVHEVLEPLGVVDVESEKVHGSERRLRLSLGLHNLVWGAEEILTDEVAQKTLAILESLSSNEDFERAGLDKPEVGQMIDGLKKKLSEGQIPPAALPKPPRLPPANGASSSPASRVTWAEKGQGQAKQAVDGGGTSAKDVDPPKPSPNNLTEETMFSLTAEEELELRTASPVLRYALALTHSDLWLETEGRPIPKPFDTTEDLMRALKAASGMDAGEVREHNKKLTSKELAKFGKEGGFSLTLTATGRGFLVAQIKTKWPDKTPNVIQKPEPKAVDSVS